MPDRRLSIAFYTEGPPFDAGDIGRRALGGSETAMVQAALALAREGHQVSVFNDCPHPGLFDGVAYRHLRDFARHTVDSPCDVAVVSRFFGVFQVPFPAGIKVLWNHDTLDRPDGLRSVERHIDLLLVLSAFHRDNYTTRLPQLDGRMQVTRNGLDLNLIRDAASGVQKIPGKLIYASRPERGLKLLLERIWPRLAEQRPELRLHICGYQVQSSDLAPGLADLYRDIDRTISADPRIVRLGSLPKAEYYRHLAEASLMPYPCTFPEISCIAALEAQACGTAILTSDRFALAETVKAPYFRVPGRPGEDAYVEEYVGRALHILEYPDETARLAASARLAVTDLHDWGRIVGEWARLFELTLAAKNRRRQPASRS